MFRKRQEPSLVYIDYVYQNYDNRGITAHVLEMYDNLIVYDLYRNGTLYEVNAILSQAQFQDFYNTDDPLTKDFEFIDQPDPVQGGLYQHKTDNTWMAHVLKVIEDLVIYDVWTYDKQRTDCMMRYIKWFKRYYHTRQVICMDFASVIKECDLNTELPKES